MKFLIVVAVIIFSNILYSQNVYTVSKNGDADFKNISQVNSSDLNPGDVVSFRSGEQFSDSKLICRSGVTYNTYGGNNKAILGDPSGSLELTVEVKEPNVTLDNLLIYGFKNAQNVIKYSANYLTVKNCEIIGGQNAHIKLTVGIRQSKSDAGKGHKFLNNKIHDLTYGIYVARPNDFEIAYNELYNFWRQDGTMDHGGYAIGGDMISGLNDTWDAKYTFHVHHNNIYNFEYVALGLGASRVLIEYNEIHHNLDERIYRGGVKHGSIGKLYDNTNVKLGGVGLVFRYNYVHDLIRRGEANHTYGKPSQKNFDDGVPNVVSTNNGTGRAVYLNAVSNNENNFGKHFGDADGEEPDFVISGLGYGNFWIHNNIFYNCSNSILKRSYNRQGGNGKASEFRSDLGSYMINNTIINCGFRDYITMNNGIMMTEYDSQSPHTVVNNIIDFTNFNALAAGRWKENKLYLDHNIYLNQSGSTINAPSYGGKKAAWYNGGSDVNSASGNNEIYKAAPGWVNISNKIFAPNIGRKGTNIPDARILEDGAAYNRGRAYNAIGDNFSSSYGKNQVGKDPTGRSFAYDILGNLRQTNDIGAVGIGTNEPNVETEPEGGIKVYLEAPFKKGNMTNVLLKTDLIPVQHPFNASPWNVNFDEELSYSGKDIVDWILVELRKDPNTKTSAKPGLLLVDGTIRNPDGSKFSFTNINSGKYHLVIRHRNHLAIMSSSKINITDGTPIIYDFTDNIAKSYGDSPVVKMEEGKWAMFGGDGDKNGTINNLDFGIIANGIPAKGYKQGDLDMDGIVSVLDYSIINKNIFKTSNIPN